MKSLNDLVSSLIELQIKFPAIDTPIFTVVKVMWSRHYKELRLYEIGAQFIEIAESTRKIIDERAKFVQEKVKAEESRGLLRKLFSGKK